MPFVHHRLVRMLCAGAALGLSVTVLAPGAGAAGVDDADADALREAAQSTGAVVVIGDGSDGSTYASGTTRSGADDLPTGTDRFRVASNTKMYVATVLMQLADEGELDLDAPIGDYLPGLVEGEGIDEQRITVRQLLQHTSGLANNLTPDVIFDPRLQWFPPTPKQMVGLGLRHGSQSEPGTTFTYSNTGYTVLGLLVEKLTGQRIGDALADRIIEPLGLEETGYAYAGQKELQGQHFRGYLGVPPALFEVTGHEPGIWAGAGALVSSGSDMTVFLDALVDGKLTSRASLAEMQQTFKDSGYGLGIGRAKTSCGTAWGHSGHVLGYVSFTYSNGEDTVFLGVNTSNVPNDPSEIAGKLIDEALCGPDDGARATLPHSAVAEVRKSFGRPPQ